MNNIGHVIYMEVAKRAEQDKRVIKVELPDELYEQWIDEGHNINSLFRQLGVHVVRADVKEPRFTEA